MERPHPSWLAIGLLSGSALAYEVLLTRLFSQIHWHSLVGFIISLALLGYGVSGTFLSLLRERLLPNYRIFFIGNALLFTLGSIAAFQLAARLPLNPMALAWEGRQIFILMLLYLLLALPFFSVANAIGLTLFRFPVRISSIYAADLLGAGIGSGAMVVLLFLLPPAEALRWVSLSGLLATLIASLLFSGPARRWLAMAAVALSAVLLLLPGNWLRAPMADYKALSQALAVKGARVADQQSNPLGVLTRVESPEVPFRHAPGLSLVSPALPGHQSLLFLDGELVGSAFGESGNSNYLDHLISALGYHLLNRPRVLLDGARDGTALGQALAAGAREIHLVETNPLLRDWLKDALARQPDSAARISLLEGSWRHRLRQQGRYDLIQMGIGDALDGVAGLRAQQENYRYTREAFTDAYQRLSADGILSVTRGLQMPPRGSLKLVSTLAEAMARSGNPRPADHLVMIRNWDTLSLLLFRTPPDDQQLRKIRHFCSERMFDLIYLPGIRDQELNRFHRLPQPEVHLGVTRLLGESGTEFRSRYPFVIEPASDDRPYFERFTRAAGILDLLGQPGQAGLAHIDWGYAMLGVSLGLALISSLLLILLPLHWLSGGGSERGPVARWRVFHYFTALGLAFLFVEIAFIQRFQLFLGAPLYAVAVTLGGFLLAAAAGSQFSRTLAERLGIGPALWLAVTAILLLAGLYLLGLPGLLEAADSGSLPIRILVCLLLIAPLGMAMGMPFPLGLLRLAEGSSDMIPWAWGINGCASVVSALLATLLAMEIGFSGLILVSALLYLTTPLALPAPSVASPAR